MPLGYYLSEFSRGVLEMGWERPKIQTHNFLVKKSLYLEFFQKRLPVEDLGSVDMQKKVILIHSPGLIPKDIHRGFSCPIFLENTFCFRWRKYHIENCFTNYK